MVRLIFLSLFAFLTTVLCQSASAADDWSGSVALPDGEEAVRLFNGENLDGWVGQTDKYFSVSDGMIRAANDEPVPVSTYLFTESEHRNFRLLFEVKQTMGERYSTMRSALALLGEMKQAGNDPYSFSGPILMFCHDWGIWGADGRGRVYPKGQRGPIQRPPYERIGDWNQIECLAIGARMRLVANGHLVVDYTEQDPARVKTSPIGLQLHNQKRAQEWHFRGLLLVDDPTDKLLTVDE